jgi:aminoglycoside phosphotransferase (APT) family kinase protein
MTRALPGTPNRQAAHLLKPPGYWRPRMVQPMDKVDITPALVASLVAAQFPQWAHLGVTRVERDGWDNSTFRLGEDMSVRLPSADRYTLQVDKEHRWLPILAPRLPLPIPEPLVRGIPGNGFPRPWSIYRWLDGEPASVESITDLVAFASELADFLAALYRIDPVDGPPPGSHNFFRGGPLTTYDAEARNAISVLGDEIEVQGALEVWDAAIYARWHGPPVWVHGDVGASNLLVDSGRLSAVIDFGGLAVGDPACDTTIAWTLFAGKSREAFQARLPVDEATWARGRGWALWKALITLVRALETSRDEAAVAGLRFGWRWAARHIIEEVVTEHRAVYQPQRDP